jgi:hypothetical protein
MKSKLFAFEVLFLWVVPAFAIEVVDTAWIRRYNGPGNDQYLAYAIAVEDSANAYVTAGSGGIGSYSDYDTTVVASNATKQLHDTGRVWIHSPVELLPDIDVTSLLSMGVVAGGIRPNTMIVNNSGEREVQLRTSIIQMPLKQAHVLLVDDDNSAAFPSNFADVRSYFTAALTANGYTYDVFEVTTEGGNGPSATTMANYPVVIWFTGEGWHNNQTLTPTDEANLASYLNQGGNLFLSAMDYFWDRYPSAGSFSPGQFPYDYLGVTSTIQDVWNIVYPSTGHCVGMVGSVADGTSFDLWDPYSQTKSPNSKGPDNGLYIDEIAHNGTNLFQMTNPSPTGIAACQYESGGFKTIFTLVDFAGLVDGTLPNTKTEFMKRIMEWFLGAACRFAPAVNYGTGDAPYSVFSSDLDGDGALDLVTANASSHDVSILKNNGNGTFQIDSSYSLGGTGGNPYRVFCADLDGDGDLDLAVADLWSVYVSILKNKGDGTFDLDSNYTIGSTPISVFCADLDRDSDLDLAVAMFSNNSVSILKNYGDGTFHLDGNYPVGNLPYSVFCADLDGDGDLDLAVANDSSDNVSILKNRGDGTFEPHVDYVTGDGSASVFCADLDGDGDLDLAVANPYSDSVSILKNNGFGTFVLDSNYAVGDGPISVFCADLNGDGNMDLTVANQWSNNVSILKNNGDGTFARAVHYGAGDASGSVFCADFDGDGDFDLAVANVSSDSVSILKNLTQVPANQPPWAFSLISPLDQDTVFGRPTFRWQTPYDPNFGDQIRYDLYVSTDPFFAPESTTIYDSLSISRFTDTLGINTYYWKVRAYDNWSAERWSTQTWSFDVAYLTDTLWVYAFSPVDLIVTDPMGNFIRLDSNTILGATYDTSTDYNHDGDNDDIVTIPNRLAGDYTIEVVAEPGGGGGVYSIGIRIDGTQLYSLATNNSAPPPGEVDTFSYNVPVCFNGDLTGDMQIALGDVVYLITFLYKNGPAPNPLELADVNSNGVVDLGDLVYLISYQYKGGPKPPCWQ